MKSFTKPASGSLGWGAAINKNWDIIDSKISDLRAQINSVLQQISIETAHMPVFSGYMYGYEIINNNDTFYYYEDDSKQVPQEKTLDGINDDSVFLVIEDIPDPNSARILTSETIFWYHRGDLILKNSSGFTRIGDNIGFYYEPTTKHIYEVDPSTSSSKVTLKLKTETTWKKNFGDSRDSIESEDNTASFTINAPTLSLETTLKTSVVTLNYDASNEIDFIFSIGILNAPTSLDVADVSFFSVVDGKYQKINVDYTLQTSRVDGSLQINVTAYPDSNVSEEFKSLIKSGKIICRCNTIVTTTNNIITQTTMSASTTQVQ